MPSPNERFKHESLEDTESIVKYLNALREGFEKGGLLFATENNRFVLQPEGLIGLEIEARRKNGEVRLSLQFRWNEGSLPDDSAHPLFIQPVAKS